MLNRGHLLISMIPIFGESTIAARFLVPLPGHNVGIMVSGGYATLHHRLISFEDLRPNFFCEMSNIPIIKGLIRRRLLLNYRVSPEVVQKIF